MMQNFEIELFLDTAPPKLARLLGYKEGWRWVAFYWNAVSNGLCLPRHFDGHSYGAVDHLAWDTFFNHRLVLAHNHRREDGYAIKRFDFGNRRTPASHWLLLDRYNRRLYAGPEAEVAKFINIFMDQKSTTAEEGQSQSPRGGSKGSGPDPKPQREIKDISEMTAWLDDRIATLEKAGKWPIFGK